MKKKKDNIIHIRGVVPLEGDVQPPLRKKHKKWKTAGIAFVVGIILASGLYAVTHLQTYTQTIVLKTFSGVNAANSSCEEFLSGILKYGKDGVSYINKDGESVWNYAYQITNPIIETTSMSAAIADVNGNHIVVLDENGVKGEIETILPIEKVSVSDQGIVAVLVRDESTPRIICYDAVGNILVEHQVSFSGTGYPIGVAISPEGTMLLVTYLQVSESGIATVYAYYDFSNGDLVSSSEIASGTRNDTLIPEVHFLDSGTSVMISESKLEIFVGETEPQLAYEAAIDKEIESVFYGEDEIGFILKDTEGNQELRVYNNTGEIIVSQEFTGDYENVSIVNNQIILYDDYECLIYTMQGVVKFSGQMEMEISGIFPVFGINKYVIIGDEGMTEIRLAR